MDPKQFEEMVCEHFRNLGYKAVTTPYSGDYGVDVFATKGKEKIAIQAKMYGSGSRKINRQMIMELHGAKDYFDCTKAIIATDGKLLDDALEVSKKLGIEIINFDGQQLRPTLRSSSNQITFEAIWDKFIMPLQGKTLTRCSGETNQIIKVDWSEVQRVTSNGKKGKIKIEIFKQAVKKLLRDGYITRDEINQNYSGRASSGIILILSQVPFFKLTDKPTGLKNMNRHG